MQKCVLGEDRPDSIENLGAEVLALVLLQHELLFTLVLPLVEKPLDDVTLPGLVVELSLLIEPTLESRNDAE